MSDTPLVIVESARRRAAEIRSGDVPVALQEGPKWVCQIVPGPAVEVDLEPIRFARSAELLARLKPANVRLTHGATYSNGWLARSMPDTDGRCRAYVRLTTDRTIEMVGMPGVGRWVAEHHAWWPGTYELPLLEQLPVIIQPLLEQLGVRAPAHMLMSLTAIDGTALVTESDDGIERPFRIPSGVDTVHFAPVCIDGPATQWREAILATFDRVRHLVGLKSGRPFYL